MNNQQMQEVAKIVMQTALETMSKANGVTVEECREAVLLGVENALVQFNELVKLGYETAVKTMYAA